MSFLIRSGNVRSGAIGNAAVLSGSIGSGQIGSGHLASGLVAGLLSGGTGLVSGQVTSGFIGNNAVVSGSIASGQVGDSQLANGSVRSGQILLSQVGTPHFNPDAAINYANTLRNGTSGFANVTNWIAAEMISGGRCVAIASGFTENVVIAMPDVEGRRPAIGWVQDNVVSGQFPVPIYLHGIALSGQSLSTAGTMHYLAQSGGLSLTPPTQSGAIAQPIGISTVNMNALFIAPAIQASGDVTGYRVASGAITSGKLGDAAVLSGTIGSGQVASGHLASGLLSSVAAGTASGLFLQYTTVELISGTRCVTLVASGFVAISRANQAPVGGSGLPCIGVVYTNTLSGQVASVMVAGQGPDAISIENPSGITAAGRSPVYVGTSGLLSTNPGSGSTVVEIGVFTNFSGGAIINVVPAVSGGLGANRLGSGAVTSGNVSSGTIGHFHISSGGVEGTGLSGIPSNIASGSIGTNDIATSTILRHQLALGPNFPYTSTMAWGVAIGPNNLITGQGQMSGGAVAFLTPTTALGYPIVPAERGSGLRLPCIGVMASGAASGQQAVVVTQGFVARDFFMASGFTNQPLYVGSGGFIVTQSGGLGGAFSGAGPGQAASSGGGVQRIGVCVSGGMLVQIDLTITSGLVSTPVGTF